MRTKIFGSIGLCLALMLAACSSSPNTSDGAPEPALVPAAPGSEAAAALPDSASAAERIAAAVEAGEITPDTAAKYQVWAQFGDPQLPQEFQSDASGISGLELAELAATLESLDAETRDEIAPFFARPGAPESAFSGDSAPPANALWRDASSTTHVASFTSTPVADSDGPQRCADWETEAVSGTAFRVWACADSVDAPAAISAVAQIVQDHAPAMTEEHPTGMGAPIPDVPDNNGGNIDDLIDIYILPNGWMAPQRGANERLMDPDAAALTMPAEPTSGSTSSAYLLLGSYLLEHPDALERIVVHELFHALQYMHYRDLSLENRWLYEGGAVWAEQHFVNPGATSPYLYRIKQLQDSAEPISSPDFQHSYAAFLWFTFMEHEGGPQAVFTMWDSLRSHAPNTPQDTIATGIDAHFDLETNLPLFALRLLNVELPGDPIDPRFSAADPAFPDDSQPDLQPVQQPPNELQVDGQGIPALGYRYTQIAFSEPMTVAASHDVAADSGAPAVVDALAADQDGNYSVVRLGSDPVMLCGDADIYLVMSNPSFLADDDTSGLIKFEPVDAADCGTTPAAPAPDPAPPTLDPEPEARGYCPDMIWLDKQLHGLIQHPRPLSQEHVDEMFSMAEPYLMDLPDGGRGHVERLQNHAQLFVGASESEAAELAEDEAFRNGVNWFEFLIQYC